MKLKYFIIGIIIIVIDQLTKYLMINQNITIIPNFLDFTYTENTGGAFGIGGNAIILVMSIILISGIILFIVKKYNKIANYFPFTLVLSGGIGNLIDRVFRGYVVDYINVNVLNFPNFNIADICITIGIILILLKILKNQAKNNIEDRFNKHISGNGARR